MREFDFPSATLHEAAGRVGALPARIKPAYPGAELIGPAFPVSAPTGDNLWIHHAVAAANPGDILVVSTGFDVADETQFGYWGEILSEAAKARQLGGLVIDGGVRDVVQLAEIGFPVFSATISLQGTVKDPAAGGSIGQPVRIGSVLVSRGDLVKADADGVVVLERATAPAVAELSRKREDDERAVIEQLRLGRTSLELFSLPNIPGSGGDRD